MGSRQGPGGWHGPPDCVIDCFQQAQEQVGCNPDDEECWCDEAKKADVISLTESCISDEDNGCGGGMPGSASSRLENYYNWTCENSDQDSPTTTTSDPDLDIAAATSPTSSDSPVTETTETGASTTEESIAKDTGSPDDFIIRPTSSDDLSGGIDDDAGGNGGGLSQAAKIGIGVGFAVAGLMVVLLLALWIQERKRRKNLEWTTSPKRNTSLSQASRSKRMSKRSVQSGAGTATSKYTDQGMWRPTGGPILHVEKE